MPQSFSDCDTRSAPELPPLPEPLRRRLADCHTLPSLPAAVVRVLMVARSPDASLADYATAIEQDPALTLRVLSLANSAFYARRDRESRTCQEAVSRIGLDATLAAVMSFGMARTGATTAPLQSLWQRALLASLSARQLAQQLCPASASTLFTVALLQDIGILALRCLAPDDHPASALPATEHPRLIAAERAAYGCDHARIGAWLAANWGIPDHLVAAIATSHGELTTTDLETLCLRLSGPIADAWLSPAPAQAMARLLNCIEALDGATPIALCPLLDEVQQQLPSMAELLEVMAPPPYDNQALLAEAQQHLFRQTLLLSARLDAQQREIEDLQRRQTDLEIRSRHDPLTGLANRAWLEEQLEQRFALCRQQQRALSVAFIDLDHFKRLNDRHGHQLGDRVLERFAAILRAAIREGDLAGRYGGEEFLVILPDETAEGAEAMAERLTARLAETPMARVEGAPLHVSVSIGIASLSDGPFQGAREMIDAADQSMYRIKRAGRAGTAIHGR